MLLFYHHRCLPIVHSLYVNLCCLTPSHQTSSTCRQPGSIKPRPSVERPMFCSWCCPWSPVTCSAGCPMVWCHCWPRLAGSVRSAPQQVSSPPYLPRPAPCLILSSTCFLITRYRFAHCRVSLKHVDVLQSNVCVNLIGV